MHRGHYALCDLLRFAGSATKQQCDDLLAAVACDEVARVTLERRAHGCGDASQTIIAGLMSVVIVVELEVIDVDHEDRDGVLRLRCVAPDGPRTRLERMAVHETGKAVQLGDFHQEPAFKKRGAPRMLERVRAGGADDVGRQQ